jgi:hypothetical protein
VEDAQDAYRALPGLTRESMADLTKDERRHEAKLGGSMGAQDTGLFFNHSSVKSRKAVTFRGTSPLDG